MIFMSPLPNIESDDKTARQAVLFPGNRAKMAVEALPDAN
jgi:hypothetical protein